jgi:hypothetical protein
MKIPDKCMLEKTVFKKLFFENAKFSVTDKKWFTTDIDRIRWKYTLKPESTLISAFKEEDYHYDEIAIIEFEVSSDQHIDRLADIIHRTIPYPLLIVFKGAEWIRLSVAEKRFNKADDQAATIKEYWITGRIHEQLQDFVDKAFVEHLSYERQPRLNLKVFYKGWIEAFVAYKVSRVTGAFEMLGEQAKKQKRIEALNEYRVMEEEVAYLRSRLKKEEAFNEKVKLNVDIKELEKQLKQTAKLL